MVLKPVMDNPIEKVKKYDFTNADLMVLWCRKDHKHAISIILMSNICKDIVNSSNG